MAAFTENQTIEVRQGSKLHIAFQMTSGGQPVDITGHKFKMVVKRNAAATTSLLTIHSDAVQTDPAGSNPYDSTALPTVSRIGVVEGETGRWEIHLTGIKTATLPEGEWQYEVDHIRPDGSTDTIIYGDFIVVPQLG